MRIPKWIMFVALLTGLWAYTGFMDPETLLSGPTASDQCVKFAKEKNFFPGDEIQTNNFRIRHAKFVVDLIAYAPGEHSFKSSRICTVGSGMIQVVSAFTEVAWQ